MAGQINLYNPALRRHTDPLGAKFLANGAALLLAAVAAAAVWANSAAREAERQAADTATQLKTAKDQLATLQQRATRKPDAVLAAELATARAALGARREILAMVDADAGAARGFADFFRGLARQAPHGLWLTGFTVAAGGTEMKIHGRSLDASLLPEFIRRLNGEPAFQGRGFSALSLRQPKEAAAPQGRRFVEFTLDPIQSAATGDAAAKAGGGRS